MKSKNILLGILAIALVFAMTAVGCKNDTTDNNTDVLDGTTWKGPFTGGFFTLTFNSPNYTMTQTMGGITGESQTNTYTISGNTVTLKQNGASPLTGTLSGNTLTIAEMGDLVFTKQ